MRYVGKGAGGDHSPPMSTTHVARRKARAAERRRRRNLTPEQVRANEDGGRRWRVEMRKRATGAA